MVLRRSVAAVAVTLATFALTGCAAEDTLSSLNQNVDTAPPSAPVNVTTQTHGSTVVLDWDASTEADVVGYDVYRYDPDPARESAYVKVNSSPISSVEYVIAERAEQSTWYRVKAVDTSANRSSVSGAVYAEAGTPELGMPNDTNEPGIEREVVR